MAGEAAAVAGAGRKRVLISGGSRGLGRAIARAIPLSHDVVTFARGEAPDDDPPRAITHLAGIDATDAACLRALGPHLEAADFLVNNLALGDGQLLPLQPGERIERIVRVNLLSVLSLTRLFIQRRLKARRGGAVLTIGSIAGQRGFPGLVAYGATKGALVSMTQALTQEFSGKGFRFNVVAPGYMRTDMSAGLPEGDLARIARKTPLRRLATVDDVAPVVAFMLSDAAGFINGQCIAVDGGFLA